MSLSFKPPCAAKTALSLAACLALSGVAQAASTDTAAVQCSPAVIKVVGSHSLAKTHYTVRCQLHDKSISADTALALEFKGVMPHESLAPYTVNAQYTVEAGQDRAAYLANTEDVSQSAAATQAGSEKFQGQINSVTASVAALPTQFSSLSKWDSASQSLSIQEKPGVWRVYSLKTTPVYATAEKTLADDEVMVDGNQAKEPLQVGSQWNLMKSGYASSPVVQGKTFTKYVLDEKASRFSAVSNLAPSVKMVQGLREGKLENLIGATRVANQESLRNALILLDRSPKDITRAWTAAAIAQFLGLSQEVRYVELKVAAHNPQLLEDFKTDVARIQSYQAPLL